MYLVHVGDALEIAVEGQQRTTRHEVVESVHLRTVADVELTSTHATVHSATTNTYMYGGAPGAKLTVK